MQPASHSSLTATKLCEIVGTQKAFLAAGGSLGSSNSTVWVVAMEAPFGMPKISFFSCTCAILHSAFWPSSEIYAAESMNAVVC